VLYSRAQFTIHALYPPFLFTPRAIPSPFTQRIQCLVSAGCVCVRVRVSVNWTGFYFQRLALCALILSALCALIVPVWRLQSVCRNPTGHGSFSGWPWPRRSRCAVRLCVLAALCALCGCGCACAWSSCAPVARSGRAGRAVRLVVRLVELAALCAYAWSCGCAWSSWPRYTWSGWPRVCAWSS
jgi:hypothetical protein